jgi:hypothetical protein
MTIFFTLVLWMMANAGPASCAAASPEMCKCGYPSVEGAFDASRAVFSGVVLEVRDIPSPTWTVVSRPDSAGTVVVTAGGGPSEHLVTLRVTRGWKGAQPGDTLTVQDMFVCGVGFRTGEEYLVYAYPGEDGALFTSPCQRTRLITPADGTHDFRLPPPGEDVAVLDSIVRARRP